VSTNLPPCGLYRTTAKIGGIDAGRLVYYHNHGDPGPGLYFPEKWIQNRVVWAVKGMTAPAEFQNAWLAPLQPEGFYRVNNEFACCAKKCMTFVAETFVQLGYNAMGKPLVFVPLLSAGGISIPERGVLIDDDVIGNLSALSVAENKAQQQDLAVPRMVIH
jgi:hypothetical protein